MKKAIAIILSIMLILVITLQVAAVSSIPVKGIQLDKSKITLKTNETSNLTITLTPANTTQKKLIYVIGNKNVATVNTDGVITGVHAGSTTVTVYTLNNAVFAKCTITVSQPAKASIRYFDWTKADTVIQEETEVFMKQNPTIKVSVDFAPNDQYMTVLKTRVLGGEEPDVFGILTGMNLEEYAKAGYIADISKEPYIKDFGATALDTTTVNGKVYAIPTKINASGVFYNKKMFSDFGLKVPESWEEFLKVCEAIKAKGIIPIAQGHKTAWASLIIPYEIVAQTAYYTNKNFNKDLISGKEKFSGPGWTDALTKYLELEKKGYFNKDFLSTDYPQATALFINRQAAMIIVPTWALPLINKGENLKDFGCFAFKIKKENTPKSFGMVASALVLSGSTKNLEASKLYLAYWASDKAMSRLAGTQAVPTKTTIKADYDPIITSYVKQLNLNTDLIAIDMGWPLGIQPILLKGYGEMFAAGRAPSEVLADLDKEMERWRKEQGK